MDRIVPFGSVRLSPATPRVVAGAMQGLWRAAPNQDQANNHTPHLRDSQSPAGFGQALSGGGEVGVEVDSVGGVSDKHIALPE